MSLTIAREDPRVADVAALIADLDRYMRALYPPESNHLLDIEALARPDIHFFVARQAEAALACGALWCRAADYGEVKRVYVRPQARGRGLAVSLLRQLEATARHNGLPMLRLETGTRQPEALALFTAYGFRRRGPFADYPPDDPLSVFMEKRVDI
jgi:putative acetyltransferase